MPPVEKAPPAPTEMPPALAGDSVLSALLSYWHRQRGSKPFPDRADISPLDLGPRLLPHIGMLELDTSDLGRSRCRLVGTSLVEELGGELTGKRLDEYASGAYLTSIISLIREMLEHGAPVFSEGGFRWHEDRAVMTRRLYLPLTHGTPSPTLMLWGQTFQRPRDAANYSNVYRAVLKD